MLFPGLALLFTVLAFNLVGDALQDALNHEQASDKRTETCTHERNWKLESSPEKGRQHMRSRALLALIAALFTALHSVSRRAETMMGAAESRHPRISRR